MKPLLAAFALTAAVALPAWGQSAPPDQAIPLSRIVADLEQIYPILWIESVRWNGDVGMWDVTFHPAEGGPVEIRLDPATGLPPEG